MTTYLTEQAASGIIECMRIMNCFMKTRKPTALLVVACIVIASVYGLQKGLALLLLWMGFQKSLRAKDYYDNTQKKWEIASFVVGVSVCICGFLSLTNLI